MIEKHKSSVTSLINDNAPDLETDGMSGGTRKPAAILPWGLDRRIDLFVLWPAGFYWCGVSILAIILSIIPGSYINELWCEGRTEFFNASRYEAMEYVRFGLGCKYDLLIRVAIYTLLPASLYGIIAILIIGPRKLGGVKDGDLRTFLMLMFGELLFLYGAIYADIDVRVPYTAIRHIVNSEFMLLFVGSVITMLILAIINQFAYLIKLWNTWRKKTGESHV